MEKLHKHVKASFKLFLRIKENISKIGLSLNSLGQFQQLVIMNTIFILFFSCPAFKILTISSMCLILPQCIKGQFK